MRYKIIEKNNHLAIHGWFDSFGAAVHHLEKTIPDYVNRGFFMDKTLTKDDFTIADKDGNVCL